MNEWSVCLQGCYELVTSFIESNMGIIAGVTFGIAFSQVLNTKSIRRNHQLFLIHLQNDVNSLSVLTCSLLLRNPLSYS